MNLAFVTRDGVLRHPRFVHVLAGCTSLRLLELAPQLHSSGLLTGVEVCDIPVADARAAREMLLLGSSIKVAPDRRMGWSADRYRCAGAGRPRAARSLENDMRTSDRLIDVPY
jgi:branched-subunit amino acid aminotransferase/4-amino-4-deoxychorismate lyase